MMANLPPLHGPSIKTALPGPRAAALIADDLQLLSPSYTRPYPLAVHRGQGAWIEDLDGNVFLDFTAGIAVCSTGHCHPRIVAAIQDQAELLLHMSGTDFYYEPQRDLAKKLASIAPGDSAKRVFFTNSGAEAVEAAFKLARYHTGRPQMIAFWGGFHGRTFGAMSLTGSKVIQRRGFSPLVPGVTHIEYPNPYRNSVDPVEHLEKLVFRRTVAAEEVAAIIVEPIQGEGGYIVPPGDFLPRLKSLCEQHGILLIADEVQSGMGRTGKMFACEHVGVEPDIVCTAKGIASGLPLGAIIARSELMSWPPGSHASTFGGNPVACVAALETIAVLEDGLMDHASRMGALLIDRLHRLQDRFPVIGDVRGRGLMVGMELVQDRWTKEPAAKLKEQVIQACFHRGLLMLGCGESTLRFCPPLVVDAAQIATAVDIIEAALIEAGCRMENGAAA
jgi:4-aminobutyrate aminotransferase